MRNPGSAAERLQRRAFWAASALAPVFLLVVWEPVLLFGRDCFNAVYMSGLCAFALVRWRVAADEPPRLPQARSRVHRVTEPLVGSLVMAWLAFAVLRSLESPTTPGAHKLAFVVAVNVAGLAFAAWLREAVTARPAQKAQGAGTRNVTASNARNRVMVPPVSAPAPTIHAATPQAVAIGRRTP